MPTPCVPAGEVSERACMCCLAVLTEWLNVGMVSLERQVHVVRGKGRRQRRMYLERVGNDAIWGLNKAREECHLWEEDVGARTCIRLRSASLDGQRHPCSEMQAPALYVYSERPFFIGSPAASSSWSTSFRGLPLISRLLCFEDRRRSVL